MCRVGGWDGVVREYGISHLIPCHSREGGNRAWVVLIILFGEYFSVVFFYSLVIRDMNLIDPIPAFAGMTKEVCAWALSPLCHREGVKRPWRSSK